MKSVISASIIFILIIVMVTISTLYVNSVTDKMLQSFYKYENNFSQLSWDELEAETEKVSQIWEDSRSIMCVLFNHQEIGKLDVSVEKIKNSVKTQKKEDYLYEKSNLILLILNLREQQKISIENIM